MISTSPLFEFGSPSVLQLDAGSLEYLDVGSGEPLVLLPGLAGGTDLLAPLIRQLAQRHRVYALQSRGESWCFCQQQFTLDDLVADVGAAIAALGLERPGLLGVSFGGAVALEFASRRPQAVSYVAVQGAGLRYRPGIVGDVARAVLGRLPLTEDNPFVANLFRVLAGSDRRDRRLLRFAIDRCWRTDQSVMARRLELLDGFDLTDRLHRLTAPTLVLAGDQDVMVPQAEARLLADRVPDGVFEALPGGGHLACLTHADAMVRELAAFGRHVKVG